MYEANAPKKVNGKYELGLITDSSIKGWTVVLRFNNRVVDCDFPVTRDEHGYTVGVHLREDLERLEVVRPDGRIAYQTVGNRVRNCNDPLIIRLNSRNAIFETYSA